MSRWASAIAMVVGMGFSPALTSPALAQSFTVITYNTQNGSNASLQMHQIALLNPRPDVVVLQEAQISDAAVQNYKNLLNSEYGSTEWQGFGFGNRRSDPANSCTGPEGYPDGEGNIILSRFPIVDHSDLLVYAPDEWWCDRRLGRARVQVPGAAAAVDVFVYHAPIQPGGRQLLLSAFKSWSSGYPADRIVGGDFNETPGEPTIAAPSGMTADYWDAWVTSNAFDSTGFDGKTRPADSPAYRIDYWFSNKASALTPTAAHIVYPSYSDHRALAVTYSFGTTQSTNLALNRPVTVSSVESASYAGPNAVDGSLSTRWSSAFSDPQWIAVDLGARYTLNRVALHWELAYAVAYQVQVSDDASNWRDVYAVSNNATTENDITSFTGDPTGRYLRIYCTVRTFVYGAQWGYSLWEIEANGTPALASDIVLYGSDVTATNLHGNWNKVSDATAAAGVAVASADYGGPVLTAAANPVDYVELSFPVTPGVDYHVWLRVRAAADIKYNDSLFVQFSNSSTGTGSIYRIGTTDALLVNLASDMGATSLHGWGWVAGAYWLNQPAVLRFDSSTATVRIQIREDGVSFDQIVLSPSQYFSTAPGGITDDHTIVPR